MNVWRQNLKMQILKLRKIFIPIFPRDHCSLVIWDKDELNLMDPQHIIERKHRQIEMKNLKDLYFFELYQAHKKVLPDNRMTISVPPEIPTLDNAYDCGVFLLIFVKFKKIF